MSVCPRLACSVRHRRGSGGKELIHAFDQKPADRITKVDLVLMAGGDKQSGGQLGSSVPFWPDSGWRL